MRYYSDHFCCLILTTKSVKQSRKLLLSLRAIPKRENIRLPQFWMFLRRTSSFLLELISLYFLERRISNLSN